MDKVKKTIVCHFLFVTTFFVVVTLMYSCERNSQDNPLVGKWAKCSVLTHNLDHEETSQMSLCDPTELKERIKNDQSWDVLTFTKKGVMYCNNRDYLNNKSYRMEGDSLIVVEDGKYYLEIHFFDKNGMVISYWESSNDYSMMLFDATFTKIQ